MRKNIKIFKRLCKEAKIFPGKHYIRILNYIEKNNSYVFYGLDGGKYSGFGVEYEIKFLKLQFDTLKALIDNDLLEQKDYLLVINDTLERYNLRNSVYSPWYENWKNIVTKANKKEFVYYFFNAYERKLGEINEKLKNEILNGMPRE